MKLGYFFAIGFLSIAFNGFSQDNEGVKREGNHQSEYNADAQQRDNAAEYDSRDMESKEEIGTERSEETQSTTIASGGGSTASPSGSPGLLNENQKDTDGTNTMQRATLNTAGSPVPGSAVKTSKQGEDDRSDSRKISGKEQKTVPALEKKSDKDKKSDKKESKNSKKDRKK